MAEYYLQNLQGQGSGHSLWMFFKFDFSSDTTEALTTIVDDYLVLQSKIVVSTAWSGGSAVVSLGTAANNGLLVNAASLAAATGLSYGTPVHFDADTLVNAYFTHDSSTSGVCIVAIEVLPMSKY